MRTSSLALLGALQYSYLYRPYFRHHHHHHYLMHTDSCTSQRESSHPGTQVPQMRHTYPFTMTPPLAWMTCPDNWKESVDARNTTQVAISEGWPGRPMGLVNCLIASVDMVEGIRGVQTGPGATAFTRMPLATNWLERPRVKETMAPLVEV